MQFDVGWGYHRLDQAVEGASARRSSLTILVCDLYGMLRPLDENKVEAKVLKPLRDSRSGPRVSYLFFTDDILLFAEAGENQITCIQEGLQRFYQASDQS